MKDDSGGYLFKKIRNDNCYSQFYIANKLGVTQSYISQIENGERKLTLNFIEKAWKELGFKLIEIDIEREKNILFKILNKMEPFSVMKVVDYAKSLDEVKNEN